MPCDVRQRLENIYLISVRDIERSRAVHDVMSEASRKAIEEAMEDSREALADLHAHRKEHGC
jgi:post-segregation antitoxin (ccd killing protein)